MLYVWRMYQDPTEESLKANLANHNSVAEQLSHNMTSLTDFLKQKKAHLPNDVLE